MATRRAATAAEKKSARKDTAGKTKPAKKAATPKAKAASTRATAGQKSAPLAVEKILGILDSLRRLGEQSYPPTVSRLQELSDEPGLLADKALAKRIAFSHTGKRRDEGFVTLAEDLSEAAGADRVLIAQLHAAAEEAVDAKRLAAGLAKPFAAAFVGSLARRIEERRVPAGVGVLLLSKGALFFPVDRAILPAAPTAAAKAAPNGAAVNLPSFADRFDNAFAALDNASGGHNYVTLGALRASLHDVPRATFDAELSALRRARRYTLDPSDGRHRQMTESERDAGIMEAGNLLVYVARRSDT
jgi:hypothetical protein